LSGFWAIIPARRSPGQGTDCLADLAGRPLLWYTVAAAREAGLDRIVVSSAEVPVLDQARRWGIEAVARPGSLAAAGVPAEDVLLHCLHETAGQGEGPDFVVLLAPELPFRRPGRVAAACAAVAAERADSLFSWSPEGPCFWRRSPGGLVPFYDPQHPPRRAAPSPEQVWLRENGSIYVCRRSGLLQHRNRLFGRIATLEMGPEESLRARDLTGRSVCRALIGQIRPADVPAGPPESQAEAAGGTGSRLFTLPKTSQIW